MSQANHADFFGEGLGASPVKAPQGRPVSADGLTYTDTGEPTREYYRRQESISNSNKIASEGRTAVGYQAGGPGGRNFSQTVQGPTEQAPSAGSFSSPGAFFSDLGAIGGYAATLGPVRDVIGEYGGDLAAPALLGPIGVAGYATDRLTGGTKTGEGSLFRSPEENAARALQKSTQVPGQPGPGTGAQPPAAGIPSQVQRPDAYRSQEIQRPDAYRSDQVMGDIRGLMAAEQKQGPSEAEALMLQSTDRAAANALGMAAGARGGAGARARAQSQALAANASMGSQTTGQVAALRAREENDRRARQQQIMSLLSGAAQAGDTRDLGYAQTEAERLAGQDRLDLGYTQEEGARGTAAASLANTAYQQGADRDQRVLDRELDRKKFNVQQPKGVLDDPLSWAFQQYFGAPLKGGRTI